MNSDEYHTEDTDLHTCRFCGLPWGDHENTCPYLPSDDRVVRSREEDRVYADLREQWTEGP